MVVNCNIPKDCKICKHASASLAWCGKYGKWVDGRDEVKYPSLIKQAGSFGKAAIKQVAAGMPKRSDDEITRIMAICQTCPEFVAGVDRCKKCGCYAKHKVPWATTRCPLRKW